MSIKNFHSCFKTWKTDSLISVELERRKRLFRILLNFLLALTENLGSKNAGNQKCKQKKFFFLKINLKFY